MNDINLGQYDRRIVDYKLKHYEIKKKTVLKTESFDSVFGHKTESFIYKLFLLSIILLILNTLR